MMGNAILLERLLDDAQGVYRHCLQSGDPIRHDPEPEVASRGVALFARHAQVREILTSSLPISKEVRAARPEGMGSPYDLFVLNRDGSDHLRLRRLVTQFFTARRIQSLEQRIANYADQLISRMLTLAEADLVSDFAEPLPMRVIADLVGIAHDDMPQIRAWSIALLPALDSLQAESPILRSAKHDAMQSLITYVAQVLQEKAQAPGDDLLTHFLIAERNETLSREELLSHAAFMILAGHETTVTLIGNGLHLLLGHPDQLELLRQRPELINGAVEEMLRYESPVQRLTFRLATESFSISGYQVEAGEQVNVLIGAANRDPAVFDRPDEFDITRSPNPHLAFGAGIHNCMGKLLSRLEARVAISRIAEVLPRFSTNNRPPNWRRNTAARGLENLLVSIT